MIFSLWEKIKLRNLNNINTNDLAKLSVNNTFSGGNTFTSSVVVPTPTQSNQAATKEYVDNKVASGGNVNLDNYYTKPETNNLLSQKANTTELTTCAKTNQLNTFNQVQTFQRGISVNNSRIMNVATPTSSSDAVNKSYVDSKLTSNNPQMLLIYCKMSSNITINTNDYTIITTPSLVIGGEIIRGSWNIVNIMFNGNVSSSDPNNPRYAQRINLPMVISNIEKPFNNPYDTLVLFYWFNLSNRQVYTGIPWFSIVLVKNVSKQTETRTTPNISLEDLKKELGEKLQELEIVSIEVLK